MHPTKDDADPRGLNGGHAAPPPRPSTALNDTAGWQALYETMLGHITGNVEVWLQNYLAEMMAGQGGAGRAQGTKASPVPGKAATAIKFVIPPWLEPFKDPANVRYTRTPDHILRQERGEWTPLEAINDDVALLEPMLIPEVTQVVEVSVERRPFVLPPNVRNTRTPDRLLKKDEPVADPEPPLELVAAEGVEDAASDEFFEVAPQPWGDVIQLGPIEVPSAADEQDNVFDRLLNYLMQRDEAIDQDAILSEHEAAFEEIEDSEELEAQVAEDEDEAEFEPVDEYEFEWDEDDEEEGGESVILAAQDEESAGEGAAPEVEAVNEVLPAVAAIVAQPANALHLSFLGAAQKRPTRRMRTVGPYEPPALDLLAEPVKKAGTAVTRDTLEQNARLLEGVLEDFGIRGEIINVRPGPVVTLYELEPAPGIKSSRVVGLADDIARSMSAVSARVAVVQGRNAIGIELPNAVRDMVSLRELMSQEDFSASKQKLAIALGKNIGGEPVIVDLAKMPHLLVAGTTGSGKSVAINTMILSLLYRLKPEECRLIMVDPKMLELSIYDGIPHLLTPVVTDPKKAVVALKWAVREMEDRYKKMSKVGVRNIDGFNQRITEAKAKGETIVRQVHTGFDRHSGEATYAQEEMELTTLPYIVVIVDEMADLMMVAGKDIEGAIQRLAQMARAAGIHLIMATQRPSVDVITGTIKANFPTRISFQVTSKIDSRTILGEQGAEQLLGQGDMLHMMGGGRISRVHGPFVSDHEVELVVNHLKAQGQPDYLDVTTEDGEAAAEAEAPSEDGGEDGAVFDRTGMGAEDGNLYDQAVKIVLRDKKCSTSYIQRRLSVGYNKAASLVERMEKEGIVGAANATGKREILIYSRDVRSINISMPDEDDDA